METRQALNLNPFAPLVGEDRVEAADKDWMNRTVFKDDTSIKQEDATGQTREDLDPVDSKLLENYTYLHNAAQFCLVKIEGESNDPTEHVDQPATLLPSWITDDIFTSPQNAITKTSDRDNLSLGDDVMTRTKSRPVAKDDPIKHVRNTGIRGKNKTKNQNLRMKPPLPDLIELSRIFSSITNDDEGLDSGSISKDVEIKPTSSTPARQPHHHTPVKKNMTSFPTAVASSSIKTSGCNELQIYNDTHKLQRSGRKIKCACSVCGMWLPSCKDCAAHEVVMCGVVHSPDLLSKLDITIIACIAEGCGKLFWKKKELENHIVNQHKTNRPYKCAICGETFVLIMDLNWHTVGCKASHATKSKIGHKENGQHIPEEMNWSPSSSVDTACTIFPSFPSIEPE
ncbi:uncharacterized protein LOC110857277 [Folsomia candida]|nr:uncharacterized protein LOC110857277 [Folsomia candida]